MNRAEFWQQCVLQAPAHVLSVVANVNRADLLLQLYDARFPEQEAAEPESPVSEAVEEPEAFFPGEILQEEADIVRAKYWQKRGVKFEYWFDNTWHMSDRPCVFLDTPSDYRRQPELTACPFKPGQRLQTETDIHLAKYWNQRGIPFEIEVNGEWLLRGQELSFQDNPSHYRRAEEKSCSVK